MLKKSISTILFFAIVFFLSASAHAQLSYRQTNIDDISEIDASIKTGSDSNIVTGTAGSTDDCAKWNADGDLVTAGAACGSGSGSIDNIYTTGADGKTATTSSASGLELVDTDDVTIILGCSDGQVLKWTEASDTWGCAADTSGGGGTPNVLDLGDDASDESTDLVEIATTGDTNSIFSEPTADKLLVTLSNNWPSADTADALSSNPADCSANQFANTIAANGNLTCAAISDADVPDTITINTAASANAVADGSIVKADLAVSTDYGDVSTDGVSTLTLDAGVVDATAIATDGVSADELNATGVEAELEAVLDLQDMQGSVLDAQVPNDITIDLATSASGVADNAIDGTDIALGADARGDIMYYDGTNWVRLAAGTDGYYLETNGVGADPSWSAPAGSGDFLADGSVPMTGDMSIPDDIYIKFGTGDDSKIGWETDGNDNIQIGTTVGGATGSGFVSIMETADMGDANRSPGTTPTNPALRIYSADATEANDFIDIYHNGSSAVVQSGSANDINLYSGGDSFNFIHSAGSGGMILEVDDDADQLILGTVDGTGNQLILTNSANTEKDHDHAAQTDPTFYIHSDTDPDTNNTQYISVTHNKTDGVIATGTGDLSLSPAGDVTVAVTLDVGGGTLEIPNSAAETPAAVGQIAIDTTEDQLKYYGSAERVISYKNTKGFGLTSPTSSDDYTFWKVPFDVTITDIDCITTGGTLNMVIQECTSAGASCGETEDAITCDTDGAADDGTLTDAAIDSGDWVKFDLTVSGTATTFLGTTITYEVTTK